MTTQAKPRSGKTRSAKAADGQPHPVDQHVGAQIRLRRRTLGVSQEKLAEKLGLTFQQVQKYERGHNRVSASKLFQIAQALDTDISHFFRGVSGDGEPIADLGADDAMSEFLRAADGVELMQLWPKVPLKARRKVLGLVRVLASGSDED
jgi:transcriptional regulator with XRE-family HTH domain